MILQPGDLVAFGPLLLAVPMAMLAGLVSFLGPCCLPLLPGYLAYSLGLGLPFLVAALGVERASRVFAWARRHAGVVMRLGGVLLILVGLLQVTGMWASLTVRLQVLVTNWQTPL